MISKLAKYEPVKCIDFGFRETQYHAAILHTAVSNAADLKSFWETCPGTGAHFYINEWGTIFQYLDTDKYTGHAWDANHWTVGIETWDGAQATIPKWNDAQVASIVALLKDLGVPAQSLKETRSSGVGYHRQYESWNKSHHSCPGDARAAQVGSTIIPAMQGGTDVPDFDKNTIAILQGFADGMKAAQNGEPRPTAGPYKMAGWDAMQPGGSGGALPAHLHKLVESATGDVVSP